MNGFIRRVAMLAVGICLMAPTLAFAQGGSTCQAYNPQLCSVKRDGPKAGTLPFTGLDVGLLVAGGSVLIGAGFVVRRLSRRLD